MHSETEDPDIYNTENYWDDVAKQLGKRTVAKIIAGDEEPYYHYKREKFLQLLKGINIKNKSVLEVGPGPGGNLQYLHKKGGAAKITGVDISQQMIDISTQLLAGTNIVVKKTDGVSFPFETHEFDIVYSVTVLQHNTDEESLKKTINEMCRVSKEEVIIFERIESKITGHESNLGRPAGYYQKLFEANGFRLKEVNFLNIQVSYLVCGAIRHIFNQATRKEGEPLTRLSIMLEKVFLPVTKILDRFFPAKRDLGMLIFRK
jgi:ubiquinone/menaquinone biosynthesis C-methylase UbiE